MVVTTLSISLHIKTEISDNYDKDISCHIASVGYSNVVFGGAHFAQKGWHISFATRWSEQGYAPARYTLCAVVRPIGTCLKAQCQ